MPLGVAGCPHRSVLLKRAFEPLTLHLGVDPLHLRQRLGPYLRIQHRAGGRWADGRCLRGWGELSLGASPGEHCRQHQQGQQRQHQGPERHAQRHTDPQQQQTGQGHLADPDSSISMARAEAICCHVDSCTATVYV
jgi:hypothetical protein